MEKTPIYADGFYFDRPRPNAPGFVKGSISIQVEKAQTFLATYTNARGYVSLDLKESRDGKLYLQLNEWVKPDGLSKEPVDENKTYRSSLEGVVEYPESTGKTAFSEEIRPEDIPFD